MNEIYQHLKRNRTYSLHPFWRINWFLSKIISWEEERYNEEQEKKPCGYLVGKIQYPNTLHSKNEIILGKEICWTSMKTWVQGCTLKKVQRHRQELGAIKRSLGSKQERMKCLFMRRVANACKSLPKDIADTKIFHGIFLSEST